jgi:hypothetical protein
LSTFQSQNQQKQGPSTPGSVNFTVGSKSSAVALDKESISFKTPVQPDQYRRSADAKSTDKKGSGSKGWVMLILVLLVGGALIWAKNRNASNGTAAVKSEQVAQVLNSAQSNPNTDSGAQKNPSTGPGTAAVNSPSPEPPKITVSAPPIGNTLGNGVEGGGQIAYRDPFAAQIGSKLEDMKIQLKQLQLTYGAQLALADKTNAALENFKQELLNLKDAGDLQAQQASVAEFQGNMASLHDATMFVSLENARTFSVLSDMKTKLDDLGKLVAAYNAGIGLSTNI